MNHEWERCDTRMSTSNYGCLCLGDLPGREDGKKEETSIRMQ
jgi:hypothetical protein